MIVFSCLFVFFCIPVQFFFAETQQKLEGPHHGHHMHIHRILLLWYYFWLHGKQTQTITSLLDWSNVRREVSRLRLDDLSILKGAPSLKMDGLFQKREGFLSLSSSDAAGVLPIIKGQCHCVAPLIQNLRPLHLHLHYITGYLFIGLCHNGSWVEW